MQRQSVKPGIHQTVPAWIRDKAPLSIDQATELIRVRSVSVNAVFHLLVYIGWYGFMWLSGLLVPTGWCWSPVY